ncbi:hypothetical protein Ddye_019194 [Dipteronia dyeriana]|uniref:Uncharacterized protein n=1 Tax=Dipteronia dyeriana TaxID=168575 RepID=A0AAD9TYF7_9ROSI|nr:hypothetical protein Ddye_019194 [Dipteronia dyeriana]
MTALQQAKQRISYKHREGALMAFECLCENLGSLFEPYVNQMLSLPLVSFSDQVFEVLKAAECAARAMMSQLSAQGVALEVLVSISSLKPNKNPFSKTFQTQISALKPISILIFVDVYVFN